MPAARRIEDGKTIGLFALSAVEWSGIRLRSV